MSRRFNPTRAGIVCVLELSGIRAPFRNATAFRHSEHLRIETVFVGASNCSATTSQARPA